MNACFTNRKASPKTKPVAQTHIAPNNALVKAKVIELQKSNRVKIQILKYIDYGNSFVKPNENIFSIRYDNAKIHLRKGKKYESIISATEQKGGKIQYKLLNIKSY